MGRSIRNTTIAEATTSLSASAVDGKSGRLLIGIISPGKGSSGIYEQSVLEAAAADGIFAAGTKMYLDHPSESEKVDRPVRSVKDLAAVLKEDARWDANLQMLVAEAKPFGAYKDLLLDEDFVAATGVSIRAAADVEETREGRMVRRITEARSIDFVTDAGRGGKVLEVFESAQGAAFTAGTARAQLTEARNVGQWIESRLHLELTRIADDMFGDGRLTREERIALSSAVGAGLQAFTAELEATAGTLYDRDLWEDPMAAVDAEENARKLVAEATSNEQSAALGQLLRDAHGGEEKPWVWVRDFDDTTVWFDVESGNDTGTYAQGYATSDEGLPNSLTGERTEVRSVTTYVPVDPAGRSTKESKEDTMPEIEESRLRELEEASGRVPQLETQLTEAQTERDEAVTEAATLRQEVTTATIERIIAEADIEFDDLQVDGLRAGAPITDGVLDEAAFTTTVTEAAAKVKEARGAGGIRGFGQSVSGEVSEDAVAEARAAAFGRKKGA